MRVRLIQCSLFLIAAFTFPVLLFLVQVAGLVPLAVIVKMLVRPIAWAFGENHARPPTGLMVFLAAHVVIFGPLLWLLARALSRFVLASPRALMQTVRWAGVVACFVLLALAGPYSVGGHSNDRTLSWTEAFRLG